MFFHSFHRVMTVILLSKIVINNNDFTYPIAWFVKSNYLCINANIGRNS